MRQPALPVPLPGVLALPLAWTAAHKVAAGLAASSLVAAVFVRLTLVVRESTR